MMNGLADGSLYDLRREKFILLADPCILRREDIVQQILNRMRLPADTVRGGDDHYRVISTASEQP